MQQIVLYKIHIGNEATQKNGKQSDDKGYNRQIELKEYPHKMLLIELDSR